MAMPAPAWKNRRLILPLFLLLLTTIYLAAVADVRPQVSEGLVGPRFMPLLVSLLMYAALLRILYCEYKAGAPEEGVSLRQPALVVLATGLYILAFKPLGYLPATFVYVAVLMHVFGFESGRPVRRAVSAALVVAVFYLLFAVIFGVRLPTLPGVGWPGVG